MAGAQKTSLRGLRTFCIAARYLSFRAAAEELFITASAVSHQIKSLEEEFGRPLFDRSGRDLTLTDLGRSLYDETSPLIEQLDSVAARYKRNGTSSSIRISVQPFFASEYFVPRLGEFTERNPDISVQVRSSDESAETYPADADLSIRLFRSRPADRPSHLLFPLRLAAAGSPEFKKSLVIREKAIESEFPLIVHETLPRAWAQWSEATGIRLPKHSKLHRLDSMIAILRAAQRGVGAALVPVPMGDLWFSEGSVVRLFDEEFVADVSYFLIYRSERLANPDVVTLRDWILTRFGDST